MLSMLLVQILTFKINLVLKELRSEYGLWSVAGATKNISYINGTFSKRLIKSAIHTCCFIVFLHCFGIRLVTGTRH